MRSLAIALVLLPCSAAAQDGDATRTVDALAQCRAIGASNGRLACFDRLAERIATARKSGDLLVLDRRQVVERKRARFGLANPAGDVFGGGEADRATEVKELDTTIRVAKPAAVYGRWNMELANGSVWQSIDPVPSAPRAGAAIKLKEASLGGYRGAIDGGRSFLVKRIR